MRIRNTGIRQGELVHTAPTCEITEDRLDFLLSQALAWWALGTSVPDPNPDPPDPHVFGPPGSGSISQRYGAGAGSGSFYHHAKIVRKT